jgi:MoaA/NifB/PqqE/SkfB family radical SAM enzyme
MKIQTLSILCGTTACNARCPFCVSKMTHDGGMKAKPIRTNWRNFETACQLAERAGVTTAMITGKGEPTLWPNLVLEYISRLRGRFPLIELQTNGLPLHDLDTEEFIRVMGGLTTVAISVVHWDDEVNREVYCPGREYPSLTSLIDRLHDIGVSVRLNCVMTKGRVDRWEAVQGMLSFCQRHKVEQFTLMPVSRPPRNGDARVTEWVEENQLYTHTLKEIQNKLKHEGTLLMELAHGAEVFDYEGQNVCLSNCLEPHRLTDKSVMRNLIFYPDGHLRYDWDHAGAIII